MGDCREAQFIPGENLALLPAIGQIAVRIDERERRMAPLSASSSTQGVDRCGRTIRHPCAQAERFAAPAFENVEWILPKR
jgi:hypothetical protein